MSIRHLLIAVILVLLAKERIVLAAPAQLAVAELVVAKKVLGIKQAGENLLRPGNWRPYEKGFQREGEWFVCDNGADTHGRRGASQSITLQQTRPEPIIASCWSRAENVSGGEDSDYSLYIDLVYTDGTPLWGKWRVLARRRTIGSAARS